MCNERACNCFGFERSAFGSASIVISGMRPEVRGVRAKAAQREMRWRQVQIAQQNPTMKGGEVNAQANFN